MIVKLGNRPYRVHVANGKVHTVNGKVSTLCDEQVIDLLQEQVTRRILLTQVRDYINAEIKGYASEGDTSFTSALMNTIHTYHEGEADLATGLQREQEIKVLEFILCHQN